MTSVSYDGRFRKEYLDIPGLEFTSLFLHDLCFLVPTTHTQLRALDSIHTHTKRGAAAAPESGSSVCDAWPSSEAKGPPRRGTRVLGGEELQGSQGKMRRGTTKRYTASNKNAHHHCEEAPQAHMPRDSSSAHKAARLNAGARHEMCDWSTVCAHCWSLMQAHGPTDSPPEAFALSHTAGGRPRICNSKLA
ncbi:hypothetical protein BN1723_000644 [Verticillium longisporum]|uniref:Uncharacterized protein n=1 Tax=Verticillium longisporum TaxID=100787 RepID=A0A0G4MYA0_VERLO|nr:hypothetical protein BN1723_000644 [Verticillium longisporum]